MQPGVQVLRRCGVSGQQTIPGPGVHDLTDEEYFGGELARESLSSSAAKILLKPGGPARYRYHADAGTVEVKREYDLGHAVHTWTLGAGPEPVLFPGTGKNPNAWQKDADKDAISKLRAEDKVPLRPPDWAAAKAMTAAVKAHPIAAKLLTRGQPERTLVWADPVTGMLCRAKLDWLRPDGIVDLKTCESAADDALSKAVHNHGYYISAAFYLRGFRLLGLDQADGREPFFAYVCVEKEPPHLVHATQLTERTLAYGDRKVSEALEIYRDCTASGVWPGYPDDEITDIDLPGWVRTEEW
jgi:hypothetical protein